MKKIIVFGMLLMASMLLFGCVTGSETAQETGNSPVDEFILGDDAVAIPEPKATEDTATEDTEQTAEPEEAVGVDEPAFLPGWGVVDGTCVEVNLLDPDVLGYNTRAECEANL